jgi:L-ascorbate metabolism protein UlaG (beta-lactamase superfamily)
MTIGRDTSLTWLGHAAVEVHPKSPKSADQVDRCDVLLVTHGHGDHMGDAIPLASRLRPAWPCIHEMSLWLSRRLPGGSDQLTGMNKGGTVEVAGLRVSMVPADHSAGDWNAAAESTLYLGEPAGFVVELENGFRIYHAGDTAVFGDMALIRDLFRPDLAMLPIGGHFTMDPVGAALAAELLGVTHVLPIHWGTFPLLAGTPAQLADAIAARGGSAEVIAWAPGDTVS